eukprot:3531802-Amphidinium_carterae.1
MPVNASILNLGIARLFCSSLVQLRMQLATMPRAVVGGLQRLSSKAVARFAHHRPIVCTMGTEKASEGQVKVLSGRLPRVWLSYFVTKTPLKSKQAVYCTT